MIDFIIDAILGAGLLTCPFLLALAFHEIDKLKIKIETLNQRLDNL